MVMSIKDAMESSPRCILLFVPGNGWLATNQDGIEFAGQTYHLSPQHAIASFLKVASAPSDEEMEMWRSVTSGERPWAAEWNESAGGWIRKMDWKPVDHDSGDGAGTA